MTAYPKFTFDLDFSAPTPSPEEAAYGDVHAGTLEGDPMDGMGLAEEIEPEPFIQTYTEDEVERFREEAFAEGKTEGQNTARQDIEHQTLTALTQLNTQVSQLIGGQEAVNAEILKDSLSVAAVIVRKLFPSLNEAAMTGDIEAMVNDTVPYLLTEPLLVIRLHPDTKALLADRLEGLVRDGGFDARLSIVGEPTLAQGDCRIEWASGGAERKVEDIWGRIDGLVADYLGRALPTDEALETAAEQVKPETEDAQPEQKVPEQGKHDIVEDESVASDRTGTSGGADADVTTNTAETTSVADDGVDDAESNTEPTG